MGPIIDRAQLVAVFDDDIVGHPGAQAAQQGADDHPQQDGGAVLLKAHAIPGGVFGQPVAQAVIPIEGVDAAGDQTEQDEAHQAPGVLPVPVAHGVHVLDHRIQKHQAIDAAGDDGQDHIEYKVPVLRHRALPGGPGAVVGGGGLILGPGALLAGGILVSAGEAQLFHGVGQVIAQLAQLVGALAHQGLLAV